MPWEQILTLGLRAVFVVLFLTAAVGKARSRESMAAFTQWITDLRILPGLNSAAAARTAVAVEAVIAAALVDPWLTWGFVPAGAMLAVFAVATGVLVRRGTRARCLCFGASAAVLSRRHVIRDAVLSAAAFAAATLGSVGLPPLPGTVLAVAAGAVVAAFVVMLDDVLELFLP